MSLGLRWRDSTVIHAISHTPFLFRPQCCNMHCSYLVLFLYSSMRSTSTLGFNALFVTFLIGLISGDTIILIDLLNIKKNNEETRVLNWLKKNWSDTWPFIKDTVKMIQRTLGRILLVIYNVRFTFFDTNW